MIGSLFRIFDLFKVRYMIISGQATVLYGAATFSEDIDLWVAPDKENWKRLVMSLRKFGAKVYKLTPPITLEFICKGHGFHFEFIPKKKCQFPVFLDVLGVLPRVGTFNKFWRNVVCMNTDWGKIFVIGLRDLVEIKKTQRLEDYSIISNLVRIEYQKLSSQEINQRDWGWILTNSFNIDDIVFYLENHQTAYKVAQSMSRPCLSYCLMFVNSKQKKDKYFIDASREIALEIETFRNNDRKYWIPIIAELKKLKKEDKLVTVGSVP